MQVVYKKSRFSTNIWSTTAGSNVPSTLGLSNTGYGTCESDCVGSTRALYTNAATYQCMSFITDAAAKILKMQHVLLIMDSPGGYRPVTYIFRTLLSSFC